MVPKYLLVVLIALITGQLLFSGLVFANVEESAVQYEKVNPEDGFTYGVKRFQEKILLQLYFFSSEKKMNYYSKLVERRLAELKFTIENKNMGNFEDATTRYSSTVGEYVNFILSIDILKNNKKGVENTLLAHIPVLEKLRDSYDPTTAEWRFVEDDINFNKIYINLLK